MRPLRMNTSLRVMYVMFVYLQVSTAQGVQAGPSRRMHPAGVAVTADTLRPATGSWWGCLVVTEESGWRC
jgi:hypothetical protein